MSSALALMKAALEAAKAAYEAAKEESYEREREASHIHSDSCYDNGDGMDNVFTYHGFHFCPVGMFPAGCDSLKDCSWHMRRKVEPYMSTYDWAKYPYKHNDFYRAAGNSGKDQDVFYCLETGRLYVPGENELFGYFGGYRRI